MELIPYEEKYSVQHIVWKARDTRKAMIYAKMSGNLKNMSKHAQK